MTTLGKVTQKRSRNLAYILSKTLAGSARTLVMSCEQGNGLEQWRRMFAREDAITDANKVNQLRTLLNTKFSGRWETYVEELSTLTLNWVRYEKRYGEDISDTMKQAMIKKNTP